METAGQLRIAMLSVHSCPVGNLGAKDTGGMSVYIRELAREMGRQGHLVDVYTRVHDPGDPQIVSLGQQARLIHLKAGEIGEIDKLAVYAHLPEFADNLEKFREDNDCRYDIVFSHYWLSGRVGEYLRQWWQVPHVMLYHTLGVVKNATGIGEQEPELRLETERELAQNCHRIIATTEREEEALIRYCGASSQRIAVIPCGVNMDLFQPVDKVQAKQQMGFADDKVILFVGRVEPLKGLSQLLRAVACLSDIQSVRLVIIGGDEHSRHEIERLHQLSRKLNIQDNITFLGLTRHEKLPYFYSAADVCVIPSYSESFGLVALESLACGTPVVATDVGDLKNIIRQGETGYVVADNNPHRLADKIALLLSRPDSDIKSAQEIRDSVSNLSWQYIAEAVTGECQMVFSDYLATVS